MRIINRFLIVFILFPVACNGLQPLCQPPQNKNQYFGFGLFMTGISSIFATLPKLVAPFICYGGESMADRSIRVRKDFKQGCKMLIVSSSMALTGFLLLDCRLPNR